MDFNEFTIFSIFQKQDFVYMILSINNREINEKEIIININRENLKFNSKYVKNGPGEPILVFIYDKPTHFDDDNSIANITYTNINKSMKVKNVVSDKCYDLTITTLFKDDYKLFSLFYEYYKNQGVEHFYMYYNGIITEEIKEVFNKEDVTLIQWNFKYWLQNCKYIHHAQLGQMHDALYKYGKYNSKYMIFCDLDEYMNIENTTLKQYILDNPEIITFGFCNHWAQTLDNKIPDSFPRSFLIGNKYLYYYSSKNIYKTDTKDVIGIHSTMNWENNRWVIGPNTITNLNMFHFYNWTQTNRKEHVTNIYNIL